MFAPSRSGPPSRGKPAKKKGKPRLSSGGTERHLHLERILGSTILRQSSLAVNPSPQSHVVAYPAGAIVVLYNWKRNRQVGFLNANVQDGDKHVVKRGTAINAKAISCLAYSSDGEYLAAGEAGHQPRVLVWQGKKIVSELVGHKYGVQNVVFSPDMKWLVSVGYPHDGFIYVWNWRTGQRLAYGRITQRIEAVCFYPDSSAFVTAGKAHIKLWTLDLPRLSTLGRTTNAKPVPMLIDGAKGTVDPHHASRTIVDLESVVIEDRVRVFAVTDNGYILHFDDTLFEDTWLELKMDTCRSLAIANGHIVTCGSNGCIRLFKANNLQHLVTLPKPHPIDVNVHTSTEKRVGVYPAVVASKFTADGTKLVCAYSDRSFFVWDLHDVASAKLQRHFLWHNDAVWGVEMIPTISMSPTTRTAQGLPPNSFATHSADGTIRFWNLETLYAPKDDSLYLPYFRNNKYSRELVRTLYVDRTGVEKLSRASISGKEDDTPEKAGVRALAVSPDGRFMASGDRLGNIRVHELGQFQQIQFFSAHMGEVLSIDFSDTRDGNALMMATASRDRMIHVFDENFAVAETLDDHTSSITVVKFCDGGKKLLSCAADKSVKFRVNEDGDEYQVYHNLATRTTTYDLAVDATSKYVALASQDRRINIHSIATGKLVKSHKPEFDDAAEGGFIKVCMDPSGLFIATSAADKVIRIFDFYTGQCVVRIPTGHSEMVTGLAFMRDCERLISTSADGCIFVWRLGKEIVERIKARFVIDEDTMGGSSSSMPELRDTSIYESPANYNDSSYYQEDTRSDTNETSLSEEYEKDVPFRYSESGLPAWARSAKSQEELFSRKRYVPTPKGRWAQRVGNEGVRLFSEVEDIQEPVATLDENLRRYTLAPDHSTEEEDKPDETSVVTKPETPTAGGSGVEKPRAEEGDLVVQDVESSVMDITFDDEPTEEDGSDSEEEEPISFAQTVDDQTENDDTSYNPIAHKAQPVPLLSAATSVADLTENDELSESSVVELAHFEKAFEQKFDSAAVPVPNAEGVKRSLSFDDYLRQVEENVPAGGGGDMRKSISARHLAGIAAKGTDLPQDTQGSDVVESGTARDSSASAASDTVNVDESISVDRPHQLPKAEDVFHTRNISETSEAMETPRAIKLDRPTISRSSSDSVASLEERKAAAALQVAKVRERLMALGISWRTSNENGNGGNEQASQPSEDQMQEQDKDTPEYVEEMNEKVSTMDDDIDVDRTSSAHVRHDTSRPRSLSPRGDSIDEAAPEGLNLPRERVQPDELQSSLSSPVNLDSDDGSRSVSPFRLSNERLPDTQLLETLASRSANILLDLVQTDDTLSSDDHSTVEHLHATLERVHLETGKALAVVNERMGLSNLQEEKVFSRKDVVDMLEKYSDILVDVVRNKVRS
ncbi:hypothetical protein HDU85_005136 [Gaertneriomyces sp. JEL0708]|nr:hypothetical protein HDU85_005136 [Gaertneriomyces sp. JEL0708]